MKIPNVFVSDEDLEEKIKEYVNKYETPDCTSDKNNKELYNKIIDKMVEKLGYPRTYAEAIIQEFISLKGILSKEKK